MFPIELARQLTVNFRHAKTSVPRPVITIHIAPLRHEDMLLAIDIYIKDEAINGGFYVVFNFVDSARCIARKLHTIDALRMHGYKVRLESGELCRVSWEELPEDSNV